MEFAEIYTDREKQHEVRKAWIDVFVGEQGAVQGNKGLMRKTEKQERSETFFPSHIPNLLP